MKMTRLGTPLPHSDRQKTLADGVFAIAMTLLVFGLGVPVVTEVSANTELSRALVTMWPEFLAYVLSFLILGVFWLMHGAVFENIKYADSTLSWLNILFLMFVALVPFSTALLGRYGAERITALFYGANLILAFSLVWSLFIYGTWQFRLVDTDFDLSIIRGANRMGIAYILTMLIAFLIAFASPVLSIILYGAMAVSFVGLSMIGRGESAYVWSRGVKAPEKTTRNKENNTVTKNNKDNS